MDRGLAHFREHGIDPQEIVETRVIADMLPFRFQILSIVQHSVGAVKAVHHEVFQPAGDKPNLGYAGLQVLLQDAQENLRKLSPAEIDAREGADVAFQLGERSMPWVECA